MSNLTFVHSEYTLFHEKVNTYKQIILPLHVIKSQTKSC